MAERIARSRSLGIAGPTTRCRSGRGVRWRTPTTASPRLCSGRQSRCPSSSRRSAAPGCSTRAAKRSRRAPPARPGRSTSCRRSPAACSRMCGARRPGPAWYQLYLVGGRDVALAVDRARAQGGLLGAGRHHRHAGRRAARTRPAQRHEGAGDAQSARRCCRSSGSSLRDRAGSPDFSRDGGMMKFPERGAPGRGADAVRRRRAARSSRPPSRGPISAGSVTPGNGPIVVKGVHSGDDARQADRRRRRRRRRIQPRRTSARRRARRRCACCPRSSPR